MLYFQRVQISTGAAVATGGLAESGYRYNINTSYFLRNSVTGGSGPYYFNLRVFIKPINIECGAAFIESIQYST